MKKEDEMVFSIYQYIRWHKKTYNDENFLHDSFGWIRICDGLTLIQMYEIGFYNSLTTGWNVKRRDFKKYEGNFTYENL